MSVIKRPGNGTIVAKNSSMEGKRGTYIANCHSGDIHVRLEEDAVSIKKGVVVHLRPEEFETDQAARIRQSVESYNLGPDELRFVMGMAVDILGSLDSQANPLRQVAKDLGLKRCTGAYIMAALNATYHEFMAQMPESIKEDLTSVPQNRRAEYDPLGSILDIAAAQMAKTIREEDLDIDAIMRELQEGKAVIISPDQVETIRRRLAGS
jgi:hypothetical protein